MKKWTKAVLATSLCLLGIGGFATAVGAATGGSLQFSVNLLEGYTDLRQEEKEFRHVDVTGVPKQIFLSLESGDLIIRSTDEKNAYFETYLEFDCSVVDGVMRVEAKQPAQNRLIAVNIDLPGKEAKEDLILYIPKDWELDEIQLTNRYGDVELSGVNCAVLTVKSENGDVTGENLTCGRLEFENDYGDVRLENITLDTGTMELENGDAHLTALSVSGGLTLSSEYGSVRVDTAEGADRYSCDLTTEYGEVTVSGTTYGGGVINRQENAPLLTIRTENGDINLQ